MKARLISACALAGITIVTLSAPANAQSEAIGTITLSPNPAHRGQVIDISATCLDKSFSGGPVESSVLEPVNLTHPHTHPPEQYHARTKVKANARLGSSPVGFKCGSTNVTALLKVIDGPVPGSPSLELIPAKAIAGAKVSVRLRCDMPEPVTSAALDISGATATVKNVKPGAYKVSSRCLGQDIFATFTVLDSKPSPRPAQVPVKPKGAAETGDIPDA